MRPGPRLTIVMLGLAGVAACADGGSDDAPADGVVLPDGFGASVLADGLVNPTQVTEGPDGSLLVGQLNGGERDGTGQVLRLDPDDPDEREVLYDGLQKPTGVVLAGSSIFVMEERRLSRGPVDGGELEVVLDELPYNGRSEGTLSLDRDGRVLYDTSGTLDGNEPADGSASLWALDPKGDEPERIATGFKHAYAHTFDADGMLWSTEISDGTYDGAPAPDELVAVSEGDDFGWPQCIGDGTPVEDHGGTERRCRDAPRSHAVFEPGATPTSVAVAPWDPDLLLVALWNRGEVVAVDRTAARLPVRAEPFLTGIDNPQHLLAFYDRLLVVDFGGGRILSVKAQDA